MEEKTAGAKGIPRIAEVLGYVGGALALGAVLTLVTTFWARLGWPGQVGLCGVVALAGIAGGYAVAPAASPALGRLRQFLLFVGVAGVGGAAGLAAYHIVKAAVASGSTSELWGATAAEWGWFAGFAGAAVAGGVIWWRERTWMQHIAFGLGVGMASLLVLPLVPIDGPGWGAGAVLTLVGVIWGALALRGRLEPENAGLSLASLGVLGGIGLMAFTDFEAGPNTWALWIGIVVSLALIGASVPMQRLVLLGFGAAGTALYSVMLITEVFKKGTGVPIALIATGVLFIGMAVAVAFRRPRGEAAAAPEGEPRAIPPAAEVLGYVGGSLTAGGVAALLGTFWTQLGTYGRIAVPLVGAAATLAGGFAIGRLGSPAGRRLEQFLHFLGAIAVGGVAGIATFEVVTRTSPAQLQGYAESWGGLVGNLTAGVAAGLLCWRRPGVLNQALFGFGVLAAAGNVVPVLTWGTGEPTQLAVMASGVLTLLIGAAWLALTLLGRMNPPNTALSVACIALLFGVQQLAYNMNGPVAWAMWLGLLMSIGLLVGSLPLKRGVMLGFGAAGTVIFSVEVVNTLFEGQLAGPLGLLVAGVLLVVMAVVAARVLPKWRRGGDAGLPPSAPAQ